MHLIADLLRNHKIPGVKLSEARHTAASAAGALIKHPIQVKDVRYKGTTVFFSIPSVLKSELLMREADFKQMLALAGITVESVK
jgi:hypothetical protein